MSFKQRDLRQADLSKTSFVGADFTEANLSGVDLSGKDLSSARLSRAILRGTILKHSNLSCANLNAADLTCANLMGADLRGAELAGARLCRARMIGARIDPDALAGADTFGAALPHEVRATPTLPKFLEHPIGFAWDETRGLIFTAGFLDSISAWDTTTCRRIRRWQAWTAAAGMVLMAYSPTLRLVATGKGDARISFWDPSSATELKTIQTGVQQVSRLMFASLKPFLVVGGTTGDIEVWDVIAERKVASFPAHRDSVAALAFSSQETLLASGSRDGMVCVWKIAGGTRLRTFQGAGKLDALAFGPEEKTLLGSSCGHPLRSWELATGRETTPVQMESVHSVAYAPDGKHFATGGAQGISIWKADDGSLVSQLTEKALCCVTELAYAPSGGTLAANDGCVWIRDASGGKEVGRLSESLSGFGSRAIALNSDRLIIAGHDALSCWEISRGIEVQRLSGLGGIKCMAFSSDLEQFAVAGEQREVRLSDINGLQTHSLCASRLLGIECVSFDVGGQLLACGGGGGAVLFDLSRRGEPHLLRDRRSQSVHSLAFHPIARFLASGGSDGRIVLWDLHTLNRPRSRRMHADRVGAICFSTDGSMLASGGSDRLVKLSDVSTGQLIRDFQGHANEVCRIAFSPTGRVVASGASCDRIILWDLTSGEALKSIPVPSLLTGLVFNPSGTHLIVSQSEDATRVWEVATGSCVAEILPLPEGWVVFDSRGRYRSSGVVAGHFWHAIGLCRFEPGELDEFMPDIKLPIQGPLF